MVKKVRVSMLVLACAMLVTNLAKADEGAAETYHMVVLDATGSMDVEFCDFDDDGVMDTRFECAKNDAKKDVIDATIPNYYYGLYVLTIEWDGYGGGPYNFGTENSPVYFTTDYEAVEDAIDSIEQTPWATPMADVVCNAVNMLTTIDDSNTEYTDFEYLYIYTDGIENFSTAELCGNMDSESVVSNDTIFYLDGTEEFNGETQVADVGRSWIDSADGTVVFTNLGRSYYQVDEYNIKTAEYDWAGGIIPGSWEWRTYYSVAWGELRTDKANLEFANYESDIIANIDYYIDEGVNTSSAKLMLSAATTSVSGGGVEYNADGTVAGANEGIGASLLSTSAISIVGASPIEESLFASLAEATNGRYAAISYGESAPLRGDVNGDGDVDATDLWAIYTWFGQAVNQYCQGSIDADINGDGYITNADMNYVRFNWTDEENDAPIMGDIDLNWCVDSADMNQVMQWYGEKVNPNHQHSYHADVNGNGFIGDDDVAVVEAALGTGCLN